MKNQLSLLMIFAAAAILLLAAGCGNEDTSDGDTSPDGDTETDGDSDADLNDSDMVENNSADGDDTETDSEDGDLTEDDSSDVDIPEGDIETEQEPFSFTRPEKGDPVAQDDIDEVTSLYLEILKEARYFQVMDERLHGWPENLSDQGYWYGTWWSGIQVTRENGQVTYLHSADGADNNGMRTAPMLSSAVFAYKLWEKEEYIHLIRKIVRGFNSWILAMERESQPEQITLMTRAHYTKSYQSTEGGRDLFVDLSQNLPGIDNGATQYVNVPDNPYYGDIWVKNMRSKDDIGHIFQAIPILEEIAPFIDDPDFIAEFEQLQNLYRAWSLQVEEDGYRIATYDKDLNIYCPDDELAYFIDFHGLECTIMLAIRLYGNGGDAGTLECGSGISDIDAIASFKPDNAQLMRSFHEAGVAMARLYKNNEMAEAMLAGLAQRLDKILDAKESDDPPVNPINQDLAELVLMSSQVGLPLTWREVRFLHERIREAHEAYLTEANRTALRLFEEETPDGSYPYDLDLNGIFFRYLGTLLGTCVSPYENTESKPVLNCDMVKAYTD